MDSVLFDPLIHETRSHICHRSGILWLHHPHLPITSRTPLNQLSGLAADDQDPSGFHRDPRNLLHSSPEASVRGSGTITSLSSCCSHQTRVLELPPVTVRKSLLGSPASTPQFLFNYFSMASFEKKTGSSVIRARQYEFGPFRLDTSQRLLLRGGDPVPLPPKALEVLLVLAENRGQVLSKEDLMNRVWPDTFVEEGNLGQSIFLIRKALGTANDGQDYIKTLPRRGYCFIGEVNEVPDRQSTVILTEHTVSGVVIEEETSSTGKSALSFRHQSTKRMASVGLMAIAFILCAGLIGYVVMLRRDTGDNPGLPLFGSFDLRKLTATGSSVEAAISPDGKYVAHVVDAVGRQSLWVRQAATANDIEIVPPLDARYLGLTFSQDSDWIYFARDSELFLIPAMGGVPRKILSRVGSPVTLSPDASQLAFVRATATEDQSNLVVFNLQSGEERVLATRFAPAYYRWPAWSPDGKTIACSAGERTGPSMMTLVEIDVEAGTERRVTQRDWSSAGRIAWVSDGSAMLMAAGEPSKHSQIWLISRSDGSARAVTSGLINHRGVSLTADSKALVTTQHEQSTNIWIAPVANTNELKQLTAGTGADDDPRWLSTEQVVYTSQAAGDRNIWVSNSDGTNRRQLTFGAHRDSSPVVSPDGTYVVFSSSRGNARSLWRIGVDGEGLRRLTEGVEDLSPSFSPDGKWIVFSRYASRWETLWKVSTDGGDAVQLTKNLTKYPVVSPDGKLIACYYWDHQNDSSVKIALIPIEGGQPVKTFDTAALTILSPVEYRWTLDGRSICYVATDNGISNIWSQDLNGGPPRQITFFKSDRILSFDWSKDGKHVVFSRGTRHSDVVLLSHST